MTTFRLPSLFAALAVVSVASIAAAQEHHPSAPAKAPEAPAKSDTAPMTRFANLYPFGTCAVLGKKLGSMGDPIIKVYDGREVRFCCPGCPPKFEKDLAASLKKLDEKIVADQTPIYPLKTSVVSGKALPPKPVDVVSGNRLVRLADESEKAALSKEPAKFIAELDKAVIAAQSKDYPASLDTCPASGEKLNAEMGKPFDIVIAGRLVRLCCAGCDVDARKEPAKMIAAVDATRKAAGAGGAKKAPEHKEGGDHSGHEHK
ncbi:MAG: hypothetical protein Q8L55_07400 [Phycisphaerales bacterium]|nr:hypothetical protein [Phycisphaerales bacterium]